MATTLHTRGGIRRAGTLFTSLMLLLAISCNPAPAPQVASPTPQSPTVAAPPPTGTATPEPTASPTVTALPPPREVVDNTTLHGKLMMGYQGWFSCPSDGTGTGWNHWFNDNVPSARHFRVDMYPDMRELAPDELCDTLLKFPDGSPAPLYSAANPKTVMRHFQWMKDYDLDGVFLQRFATEITDPVWRHQRQIVMQNVRAAAEATGRVFAIEYDIANSESDPALVSHIENDWKRLVDVEKITESPSYLHHNGKPLVGIFGLGLNLYDVKPSQAMELVDFFENNPEPRYQVTLFGGVADSWHTLNNDALSDPAWADYYCALDIISPWTVGRYFNIAEADGWRARLVSDMQAAQACGVEYMPVVWPGTAFHNNNNTTTANLQPETVFNLVPRQGGRFYWRQVYNAVMLGSPMIFNAMFDEIDEDTAMFKLAETTADQPADVELLSLDADGEKLPSDWYLRLAGAATRMLRGEIPLTDALPLNPDGSLLAAFPTAVPTPPLYSLRVLLSTSSDWTKVEAVKGGGFAGPIKILSVSPEATGAAADAGVFYLEQPLARAEAAGSVAMSVELMLTGVQPGSTITFEIQRGSIGATSVTFTSLAGEKPVIVASETWDRTFGSDGLNRHQFTVPVDVLIGD